MPKGSCLCVAMAPGCVWGKGYLIPAQRTLEEALTMGMEPPVAQFVNNNYTNFVGFAHVLSLVVAPLPARLCDLVDGEKSAMVGCAVNAILLCDGHR